MFLLVDIGHILSRRASATSGLSPSPLSASSAGPSQEAPYAATQAKVSATIPPKLSTPPDEAPVGATRQQTIAWARSIVMCPIDLDDRVESLVPIRYLLPARDRAVAALEQSIQPGQDCREITAIAVKWLKRTDEFRHGPGFFDPGFAQKMRLLEALFKQNHGFPEVIACATSALLDPDKIDSQKPLTVFKLLFEYGQGYDAAWRAVQTAFHRHSCVGVREYAKIALRYLRPYVADPRELDAFALQAQAVEKKGIMACPAPSAATPAKVLAIKPKPGALRAEAPAGATRQETIAWARSVLMFPIRLGAPRYLGGPRSDADEAHKNTLLRARDNAVAALQPYIQAGQDCSDITAVTVEWLERTDERAHGWSIFDPCFAQKMRLLEVLFAQEQGIPEISASSASALVNSERVFSQDPVAVFTLLFARGHGHEVALTAVKAAFHKPCTVIIEYAQKVLQALRPYVINVREIDDLQAQGAAAKWEVLMGKRLQNNKWVRTS